MNHTAKTEKERSVAESSQEKPSDSNIDITTLRNRYSDGLDPDSTMYRILVRWRMRSLQETMELSSPNNYTGKKNLTFLGGRGGYTGKNICS
jgi:hypothetical protein